MIEVSERRGHLYLIYEQDYGADGWIERRFESGQTVVIARNFHFLEDDLVRGPGEEGDEDELEASPDAYIFALGAMKGSYLRIAGEKLGIEHNVYLGGDVSIRSETFIATRNISIFRHIARVTDEDIYIGGDHANAMPASDFERLLDTFPNSTELDKYADAKVARLIRDYFETASPAEQRFEAYVGKRARRPRVGIISEVYEFEVSKYVFIRNKITELLKDERSYSGNEWRDLMLQFILLIFPKYICVLRNVLVKDLYTTPKKPKNRYIDIGLVDANGQIDIIEIKKPFRDCLMSASDYRGSFTPRKERSCRRRNTCSI
jgi:hypothetical protein